MKTVIITDEDLKIILDILNMAEMGFDTLCDDMTDEESNDYDVAYDWLRNVYQTLKSLED